MLLLILSVLINPAGEKGTTKRIFHTELGQAIYTPYSIKKNYLSYLDRPFTGFLYAKGGLSYFFRNENVFRWNVLAGVVGEAAKGEEVQRLIHNTLGFLLPQGWQTQLKSELGINLQASYSQHFSNHTDNKKKAFDAFAVTNATAGTTFTRISQGVLFRVGAIEPSYKSVLWDGGITNSPSSIKYELFFYFEPSVEWQLYNATIQGGVFTKDDPFTTNIQPLVYRHRFGGMYSKGRTCFSLGYTFTTKEAKTMIVNSTYGTMAFGLKF